MKNTKSNVGEPEAKGQSFDHGEIMTRPEIETLLDSILMDVEFHPYAVYGLIFLFGSIKKLDQSGRLNLLSDIYLSALTKLYSVSWNMDTAIDRLLENIDEGYRASDWTNENQNEIADAFVQSEKADWVKSIGDYDDSKHITGDLDIDNLALQVAGTWQIRFCPKAFTTLLCGL